MTTFSTETERSKRDEQNCSRYGSYLGGILNIYEKNPNPENFSNLANIVARHVTNESSTTEVLEMIFTLLDNRITKLEEKARRLSPFDTINSQQ